MLFNWISGVLQGVFGTLIYEALLAGGVGVLIGVLKAKREKWAGPALYGFAAFVLCFVLGFTLLGHGPLSKESPQTTSQNVEANIRAWADDFNLSIKKMEAANVEFQYALTLPNGNSMFVTRPKDRDGYIVFSEQLTVSTPQQKILSALPPDEQKDISDAVLLEASRLQVEYAAGNRQIALLKPVPITSNLTEGSFMEFIDLMDNGEMACKEAVRVAIERFKPIPD